MLATVNNISNYRTYDKVEDQFDLKTNSYETAKLTCNSCCNNNDNPHYYYSSVIALPLVSTLLVIFLGFRIYNQYNNVKQEKKIEYLEAIINTNNDKKQEYATQILTNYTQEYTDQTNINSQPLLTELTKENKLSQIYSSSNNTVSIEMHNTQDQNQDHQKEEITTDSINTQYTEILLNSMIVSRQLYDFLSHIKKNPHDQKNEGNFSNLQKNIAPQLKKYYDIISDLKTNTINIHTQLEEIKSKYKSGIMPTEVYEKEVILQEIYNTHIKYGKDITDNFIKINNYTEEIKERLSENVHNHTVPDIDVEESSDNNSDNEILVSAQVHTQYRK